MYLYHIQNLRPGPTENTRFGHEMYGVSEQGKCLSKWQLMETLSASFGKPRPDSLVSRLDSLVPHPNGHCIGMTIIPLI
jgi:hypothetical protein